MIIGVDIGGTETFIAALSPKGEIEKEVTFSTPKDYDNFLEVLSSHAASFADVDTLCAGVPGLLDRKHGVVHSLGNLPWVERPIRNDLKKAFGARRVMIENDSKLAGLSEVRKLNPQSKRALYITISTGIGGALVINNKLCPDMIDMEIGKIPLLFEGTLQHWEDFGSGRAFSGAYGKHGDEVGDDPALWERYVIERLGPGMSVVCSYLQVDTIVFGGGLGHHSSHFTPFLRVYLDERLHPIVRRPETLKAARHGKNAVIYGCYEYIKDHS